MFEVRIYVPTSVYVTLAVEAGSEHEAEEQAVCALAETPEVWSPTVDVGRIVLPSGVRLIDVDYSGDLRSLEVESVE